MSKKEADFIAKVNGSRENNTEALAEATSQLTESQMRDHLKELIAKSPSRQRARYNPDFSLTPEYEELVNTDTSNMRAKELKDHTTKLTAYKRAGGFSNEVRQAEIDKSLAMPISDVIKLRDSYIAQIQSLEAEMDSFSEAEAQAKVDEITEAFKERSKGLSRSARAGLQAEYEKECDEAEMELYTKPRNALAVKRYEAIELYKVYENRVKLYVSLNREAIAKQIERARDREITENLLALAEYMEG